jgi:hypothetical protein
VTHHLSTSELEQFCVSALAEDQLAAAASHTADCKVCHERFVEELRRQRGPAPSSFTLEPEFWFRNDHVDFDLLVGLADKTLDDNLQEIIDVHLRTCEVCSEDVRTFLASREATAGEMKVSYSHSGNHAAQFEVPAMRWWERLPVRPAYALSAAVLVAIALLVGVIALNRRSGSLEAGNKNQTETGGNESAGSSPSSSPNAVSTPTAADNLTTIAKLNDVPGEVTIDKSGRVTGLDETSEITRQQIARAVLSERIDTATVLRDLAATKSGLRGTDDTGKEARLLYPGRRVVVEDRPVFKWGRLPEATYYRVYVLDANGNQVVQSEDLPQTQTEWRASTPLRRGQTFSWFVTTLVDGKEVVSPPASAPEMKFAVLSTNDLTELSRLKKQNSRLALGVFYARAGLLTEAEREFQQLIQLNPQSELPRKLLQSVRSMRRH